MFLIVFIIIIGISFLILVHELGHFLSAKYFGISVEEFGIGFPPRLFSKKIGETKYSVNSLPLGGFVKLRGEFDGQDDKSFMRQSAWKRAIVLVAGVTMNFIFGWLLLSAVFFIGAPSYVLVNKVSPDSLAEKLGIVSGDRIVGFDSAQEFSQFIKNNQGQEIVLPVLRNSNNVIGSEEIEIKAVLAENGLGVLISDIGVSAQSFSDSVVNGFISSWMIMWSILISLGNVFNSADGFVGPIGIFDIAIETGKLGIIYIFQLLALISLNLTILNLLPIPALDGGRLFFILIEKLRGKAFTAATELKANTWGFAFLITLIALITFKDVAGLL